MTNEELKRKIVEVIREFRDSKPIVPNDYGLQIISGSTDRELADALIAAGIGDVSELKKHRVVVEKSLIPEDDNAYVLPNIPPTVKQLYSGEEVEQIVKEREEYKHRAARAERALKISSLKIATMIDEEVPACDVCENYQSCNLTVGACSEYMEKCCVEQAERELAEEGKDGEKI